MAAIKEIVELCSTNRMVELENHFSDCVSIIFAHTDVKLQITEGAFDPNGPEVIPLGLMALEKFKVFAVKQYSINDGSNYFLECGYLFGWGGSGLGMVQRIFNRFSASMHPIQDIQFKPGNAPPLPISGTTNVPKDSLKAAILSTQSP